MSKKTAQPIPCGECPALLRRGRVGYGREVIDHFCQLLPPTLSDGKPCPGQWLGFLPVRAEECPCDSEHRVVLMDMSDDDGEPMDPEQLGFGVGLPVAELFTLDGGKRKAPRRSQHQPPLFS